MRGFTDFDYYVQRAFIRNSSNPIQLRSNPKTEYSIIAKVLNNKIYVPVFMNTEVEFIIRNEGFPRNSDIVYNISGFRQVTASTTSNILKKFFTFNRYTNFTLVRTNKGCIYRGTKGLILDDAYNPLLIFCNVYDIVDGNIENFNPVCLISPRIFNNTDIISKFIVKSIPSITGITIDNFRNISVLITDDIDSFVYSPKVPACIDFNESIYEVLDNHINEIVDDSQGILQGLDNSD